QLRASVRTIRKIAILDQVVVRIDQVERIPHPVGARMTNHALPDALAQNATARGQLAPTVLRVVVIIRKITIADRDGRGLADQEPRGKAVRAKIGHGHSCRSLEAHPNPGGFQRWQFADLARTDQSRPIAVDAYITGPNHE